MTASRNECPELVPAVQQWRGGVGTLTLTASSRIMIDSPRLGDIADQLRTDLRALIGLDLDVTNDTEVQDGDLHLSGASIDLAPESYTLEIAEYVQVSGASDVGVFHGTQTLLQLFRTRSDRCLPRGEITDWPRFRERGLLLDVGRKFWAPDYILQVIRRLAYLRMNTLQLHFSDDNAFRLVSQTYPALAAPQAYTRDDIRRFEAAARRFHVTIIPEIEMPSHSAAVLKSLPGLGFSCPALAGSTLDVTNSEARQFARDVIDEFAPLFAGPEFHIAADEYPTREPQSRCPQLADWARSHGLGGPSDAFVDFINDMNRTVRSHGKTMVIWNWWDVDQTPTINPDRSIKVEAWTTAAESTADHSPQKYLDMGYDVVVSPSDLLYVTPGFPLLPDPRYLYEEWTPQEHPRLAGYQLSVWANDAIEGRDDFFDDFLRRPLEVLADRSWGGPRIGSLADFYLRADAVGTPPGQPNRKKPPDCPTGRPSSRSSSERSSSDP